MANIADDAGALRLMMLGGFNLLQEDEQVILPVTAQRLVALLALRDRPLSRTYLAGVLWPDCPAERSLADLRTALWRANHGRAPVIAIVGMRLSLRTEVQVDVRALVAFGRAAGDRTATSANAELELAGISWPELALDLLPDWYDDWLVDDRAAPAAAAPACPRKHDGRAQPARSPRGGDPGRTGRGHARAVA